MDSGLKQRLVGAGVLVALMVLFLPMLIKDPAPDSGVSGLSFNAPTAPVAESGSIRLPSGEAEGTIPQALGGEGVAADHTETAGELELPPAAANGVYVVHFAAFATQDEADLTVRQLQARGLPAFAEDFTLSGRPAVRVRVGPYLTQAEAETVRVQAAQVREDVRPRVFMLIDQAAAERTAAALERASAGNSAAAAPTVGFVVQLGAFSHAAKATALQERLRKAGIVAFTDTIRTSRGTLTRVNAGPVSSRTEVERLKAKAKTAVGIEGVVRSHP